MIWRWLRDRFGHADKSVLAYRDIALLPDPPEMFDADGRNKRARVSRFSEPDKEKLAIKLEPVEVDYFTVMKDAGDTVDRAMRPGVESIRRVK